VKVVYVSKASRVAAHRDKLALLKQHVDLVLVTPARWGSQPDEAPLPGDPRTVVLPALLHGRNHFHVYRGLAGVLERERPDLVHADEEPYSAVTGQVGGLCRRRGIPFVFFAWQNLDKRLPPPFGALRRSVFRSAAGGIAGTVRAGAVLRRAGFDGPLAIIPQMGVDEARFRPDAAARARVRGRLGVSDAAFVVGYAGRLVPEKGVDLVLGAASALPDAHVLVIGAGPEEAELRRRAASLGIDGRTHWAGGVASAEMPEWLAALDVLVLPSRTTRGWAEQFGRVLVEAMACGVAVIGSSSGEIPSVIGDGGIVVPEGSLEELRATLAILSRDADALARWARLGRARALAEFSQRRVVEETLAFHRRVLAA
jgi:glycosyltransferase involved in cell wall biosynthesis